MKKDQYASEAETAALMKPDTRTSADRKLDKLIEANHGDEQGAELELVLRAVALQLIAEEEKQEQGEPLIWSTTQGGAFVCGEYHVVQRVDDKGWNAHKGYEHLLLAASFDACKTACERDAAESLSTQEQGEPVHQVYNDDGDFWEDVGNASIRQGLEELGAKTRTLYTTPQHRKPLTDETKHELWRRAVLQVSKSPNHCVPMNWQLAADVYAELLEAAHGIKDAP